MYIDIHRHSKNPGKADIVLRNLYPDEVSQIKKGNFFSVGLHPWYLKGSDIVADMQSILDISAKDEVIAIGETGLDYNIETNIQIQREVFHQHIEIAKATAKPIIIHCVKAYSELLKIRKDTPHQQPWIIHWFNASPEMGRELIIKNCYLSFGISLFKNNSKAQKTFLNEPLEYIFLETDDAEITIIDVYKKAADLKGITVEELAVKMQENFSNCFGIEF